MPPPIPVPGWTAIHSATADGDPVALRAMIAVHPGDLDAVDKIGRSPLHLGLAMGPAGMSVAYQLFQAGAALLPLGGIAVEDQRGRIWRHAGHHPHRRAAVAYALWAMELGRRAKPLSHLPAADREWVLPYAALVGGDVQLRVLAMIAAAAPQ